MNNEPQLGSVEQKGRRSHKLLKVAGVVGGTIVAAAAVVFGTEYLANAQPEIAEQVVDFLFNPLIDNPNVAPPNPAAGEPVMS